MDADDGRKLMKIPHAALGQVNYKCKDHNLDILVAILSLYALCPSCRKKA